MPDVEEASRTPIFSGTYCRLLPLTVDDAPLYDKWLDLPGFQAYHPLLRKAYPDVQALILHVIQVQSFPQKFKEVLIWHRQARQAIGLISLGAIDKHNGKAELSVGVVRFAGSRCLWEAVHAALTLCFERMKLHKLVFHVDAANASLCSLLRRGGAREEGLLVQEIEAAPGRRTDLVRFALFRGDYKNTPLLKTLQRRVPVSL